MPLQLSISLGNVLRCADQGVVYIFGRLHVNPDSIQVGGIRNGSGVIRHKGLHAHGRHRTREIVIGGVLLLEALHRRLQVYLDLVAAGVEVFQVLIEPWNMVGTRVPLQVVRQIVLLQREGARPDGEEHRFPQRS